MRNRFVYDPPKDIWESVSRYEPWKFMRGEAVTAEELSSGEREIRITYKGKTFHVTTRSLQPLEEVNKWIEVQKIINRLQGKKP